MNKQYQIAFIGFFVVNVLTIIAIFMAVRFFPDQKGVLDKLVGLNVSLGVFMFLSLWGRMFRVRKESRSGKALNGRTTILLTMSLLIIDTLLISGILRDHHNWINAAALATVFWIGGFFGCLFLRRNLIIRSA